MPTGTPITQKDIARLWSPLALTWLLMATEGPLLAAVVARLASPALNLAAYGVAVSIAMIMESPIIMLMSASTKLVKDPQSYVALRRFSFLLNAGVTVIMGTLLITGAMYAVVSDLIGLPPDVADLTISALWLMLPWPAAIGARRFYQGLLISSGKTRLIAYGTVLRLSTIAGCAFFLSIYTDISGALIGAVSLSAAVTAEAVATRIMCRGTIARVLASEAHHEPLTLPAIVSFYHPLALMSFIALAVNPAVSFFLGRSTLPVESLAVFPVVSGFIFLFRGTFGLSFQEIGLSMMEKHPESLGAAIRFAALLGAISTIIVGVVAFTPLGRLWFEHVAGLSIPLAEVALPPLMILSLMPGLSVLLSFQRAALMSNGHTGPITIATALEVGGTVLVLLAATNFTSTIGATAGALALMIGRIAANVWLMAPMRHSLKQISERSHGEIDG